MLETPWTSTPLSRFSISRDGSRIAVITSVGNLNLVSVVAVHRDLDGTPLLLSKTSYPILTVTGNAFDLAWNSPNSISVLSSKVNESERSAQLSTVTVGGVAKTTVAPANSVQLDMHGRNARILTSKGELFGASGVAWQVLFQNVSVLADQLGAL